MIGNLSVVSIAGDPPTRGNFQNALVGMGFNSAFACSGCGNKFASSLSLPDFLALCPVNSRRFAFPGDFTIEAWVKPATYTGNPMGIVAASSYEASGWMVRNLT